MMYSEFVAGTGCRENEHNYEIFKALEKMYMDSDITKQEVYAFGKKVVDNSKTEKELELEGQLKEDFDYWQKRLQDCKDSLECYEILENKNMIKYYKQEIKFAKIRLKEIEWVLA